MKSQKRIIAILFIAVIIGTSCSGTKKQLALNQIEVPGDIPFDMPVLTLPVFPDAVFNIVDYGAVSDEQTKNTEAIAHAIAACADAGGGTVLIPNGKWITGPIHLKSNINFHLEEGAEILFSQNPEDYLPVVLTRWEGNECYNYSPLLYARDCENIAITGKGILNGQGQSWWHWKHYQDDAAQRLYDSQFNGIPVKDRIFGTEKDALRPALLQLFNCSTVLLEDYTSKNSPFWNNQLVYCNNVVVRNIRLINPYDAPNGDGLDIDSSKDIYIKGIYADVGDDALVIKSGLNEDGWRVNRPSENIVAEDYHIETGHGGFVIGSEMSGGVKNVLIRNCSFKGTELGIRIKSKRGRGSYVKNIWLENIEMEDIHNEAIRINMFYPASSASSRTNAAPDFSNINLKNINCKGAGTAIFVRGLPEHHAKDIHFENISITCENGLNIVNLDHSSFKGLNIIPNNGPAYSIENCIDIELDNCSSSEKLKAFLSLEGELTSDIRVLELDKRKFKTRIEMGENVKPSALIFE